MTKIKRPPIITIMGHVDHGKTTLLDFIRRTNVQGREPGGITQHIGAYQIEYKNQKITFIDTPGHAAFNKMRQRGAQITDLVILVVAANDGVKPQTVESIKYIKEANVPFIVAINKIDLPDINLDQVKSELAQYNVLVTDYGGDVDVVNISAKTGKGVDELLDMIVVMADILDLEAEVDAPLEAIVIESTKDLHRGPLASVIVKQGKLLPRQKIYCNGMETKVRSLIDENGHILKQVLPGDPAEIIGFDFVPEVGWLVSDVKEKSLKKVIETQEKIKTIKDKDRFDLLMDQLEENTKLNLIIKADVNGTLEAIIKSLDEDVVNLIYAGVGEITKNDIDLAKTSNATIIAFMVKPKASIKKLAEEEKVKIKYYDIIYHLLEDIEKAMLKIMEPTIDMVETGTAEILEIFEIKSERIAGIRVKTGELKVNDKVYIKRGDEIIGETVIKTMKHGKDDVLSVKAKNEAGITFKDKIKFEKGDTVVAFYYKDE